MKTIITIGDSYTQGVGAYTEESWNLFGDSIIYSQYELEPVRRQDEKLYSWPAQLIRNHMPDYDLINVGVRGNGNRASVRSLYFIDKQELQAITEGYLIFLLSGWVRFDFIVNPKAFYKFKTVYPNTGTGDMTYDIYAEKLYNKESEIAETLCCIVEAQNFAKAYNLKFIFAHGFDKGGYHNIDFNNPISCLIDPSCYMKSFGDKPSALDYIMSLDVEPNNIDYYKTVKRHTKYLTNCLHPTIQGHQIIAQQFYNFIQAQSSNIL